MKSSGSTILITGGASGIGLALARMFVDSDNRVIMVGRNQTKLRQAARLHDNISTIQCDISKHDELEKLYMTFNNDYADLNVLINNAAIQHNYSFIKETMPYTKIDEEIDINFRAVVKLSVMLMPVLSTKPESAIVNVASGLAFAPKESAAVYCATKAAVDSFTTTLRYQLENTSIRVFELIPPLVETAMTAGRSQGKMPPEDVALTFRDAWLKNQYEVSVGKIKIMRTMLRWFPGLIRSKLRHSV